MSAHDLGCVETPVREERAELLSQLSYLDAVGQRFVFQIDEVETNFLSEISISEFLHSQDPEQTFWLSICRLVRPRQ
jgi:hypothetical protein